MAGDKQLCLGENFQKCGQVRRVRGGPCALSPVGPCRPQTLRQPHFSWGFSYHFPGNPQSESPPRALSWVQFLHPLLWMTVPGYATGTAAPQTSNGVTAFPEPFPPPQGAALPLRGHPDRHVGPSLIPPSTSHLPHPVLLVPCTTISLVCSFFSHPTAITRTPPSLPWPPGLQPSP